MTENLSRPQALQRVIDFYLSEEYMRNPQHGCALAALGAELARYPKRSRAHIARALDRCRIRLQSLLPGATATEHKVAFNVLFPSMAGCLIAARTEVDPERKKKFSRKHAASL